MVTGRPSKYSEEILERTEQYIESCEDDLANKIVNLPTIEGLAYELKVNKTTIYEWRKIHEDFSNLIADLLAKQAKALVNCGLAGTYNSTIAKVLLTKHGYREGQDITTMDEKLSTGVIMLPQKNDRTLETTTETDRSAREN